MGIFSYIFYVIIPALSVSTIVSLRLGNELPKAATKTGRSIGMGYNYLKILLKHMTPRSNSGVELVRKMRQTGQQAFAFSNEVKWNLVDTAPLINQALPGLTQDPFEKFGILKNETKILCQDNDVSKVLLAVIEERKRIIDKKKNKEKEENTLNKL